MNRSFICRAAFALVISMLIQPIPASADDTKMRVSWKENYLTITGPNLPGREMKILYIEAYCRPGATNQKWEQTTIGHKTRLISAAEDGHSLMLECTLKDGVIVKHEISATEDTVDFHLTATNPTDKPSLAQWAQPCIRVDKFTGG